MLFIVRRSCVLDRSLIQRGSVAMVVWMRGVGNEFYETSKQMI
jgi:hypothetical protein